MKKSMLKQSVIALMVGAAVSGVSVAADTDPLATATSALKEAIKSELQAKADATKAEQDKKINDIKSKLKELASFVLSEGSEDAPTLAYQLKQLSDKLDNKVDASRVDKIVDELNKISELTDEHGDKFDELKNVLSTLGDRDAELAGKVNDLTGKVSDLESSDDANGQDISDLKEAVFGENGKSDTNGLVKNVEDIANEVDKLKNTQTFQDLEYVKNSIKDVRTKTKDAIEGMAKHLDEAVLPAIEANRSDIDKNASHITDIRNKQALQNARLDNHGERIEANKAAIGDLATATDKAVKNLGDAVRDLDEDLAGTQDAVAENRKDIDKNASRITDTRNKQVLQNARLDNHGERIDANKAAIADNASKIATNELKVSENRKDIDKNASRITDTRNKQVLQNARLDNHGQRIDANKAAIATNVANIATNTAAVATNTAAVATNTAAVATNRANIATNTAAIAAHNQRLDHLDNRVNKLDKDLKRGLASQAALTGLFQPYTVGKANFTAAVGGYKSQTAVAIGTGYRYNQNIATKAGVAFTQGGGVTYNAGVNFEW